MRYLFFFFTQSRKNVFSSHIFVHLWLDVYPRFLIDFFNILNYIFHLFLAATHFRASKPCGASKAFWNGPNKNSFVSGMAQYPVRRPFAVPNPQGMAWRGEHE
jgi:hypothetical protein